MQISVDAWLKEAKSSKDADKVGMWFTHNGVVRSTAKAEVREGKPSPKVTAMNFSYDKGKLEAILEKGRGLDGVYYLRAELAEGRLMPGDDIMFVLVGADTRPHAVAALNSVVSEIKECCVKEEEIY